jgi:hypothetical protein
LTKVADTRQPVRIAHRTNFLLPSSFFLLPSSFFLLPSSFFLGGVTKIAKSLTESGLQPSSPVDKSSVYLGLKSLTVQQERRSCPDM